MKRTRVILIAALCLWVSSSLTLAQSRFEASAMSIIEPYPLGITFFKTTHLIFPYPIKSVDRGSRDILAQKAKGVENILLVKAGKENFTETNLSVITADGKFYSFLVGYSSKPSSLTFSFVEDHPAGKAISLLSAGTNAARLQQQATFIARQKQIIQGVKDRKGTVQLRLTGLYIQDDVLFFQLVIQNRSPIRYQTDLLRFFIRDKRTARRTASQEMEISPLYVAGDASTINGPSRQVLILALPKFTLPDQKYLAIQWMERNGGRHLQLQVSNHTLAKARPLVNQL